MWHVTYTHTMKGDYRFLMVKNQLTLRLLAMFLVITCVGKHSNGLCNPILDIYVLIIFQ
jgi:hypothetical protein